MTTPSPDLRARLEDPGFTPGAAHFDELFALLESASRDEAPRIERALSRAGVRALSEVLERLPRAAPEARASLVSVLGRLADPRASAALREALANDEPRVKRRAANALGKLEHDPDNDRALRAAWEHADVPLRRTLAEALGKVGGPEARALLDGASADDPELRRLLGKALLLLARRASRDVPSTIASHVRLERALPLLVSCRAGLAGLLADELRALGPVEQTSDSLVELPFGGTLAELLVARTALDFGFWIALGLGAGAAIALPDAVARALSSPEAELLLRAWTSGAPRFRLSFAEGGHRRALVFQIAEAVARAVPGLVNDSRAPTWEIVVAAQAPRPHLVLVPLAFDDTRFAYRTRDVRAASHPTIAAALARTAGVRADDVVWDPFAGSGLELIERARLGPYRALLGSDLDPEALAAARENLEHASVKATLSLADATSFRPEGVSCIITNPPMGRRLVRDRTLAELLDRFVANAAQALVPGGRLVWLSPLPERTRAAAAAAGLRGASGRLVDMGGFQAELQTLQKR